MKERVKKKKGILDYKFKFIVSDELNKLKGKNLAPEKLALANEHLKKRKSLPE
jgi:hypothetical protein